MNGNEILTHAVPIWFAGSTSMPDEYAEFDADFSAENTGKFEFYIAAGSEYSLYLDGRLIGFGQYQDYPGRLIYDTLTFDAEAGEHTLRVIAWHWGVDSFTHTKHPPYVIFRASRHGGRAGARLVGKHALAACAGICPL